MDGSRLRTHLHVICYVQSVLISVLYVNNVVWLQHIMIRFLACDLKGSPRALGALEFHILTMQAPIYIGPTKLFSSTVMTT